MQKNRKCFNYERTLGFFFLTSVFELRQKLKEATKCIEEVILEAKTVCYAKEKVKSPSFF